MSNQPYQLFGALAGEAFEALKSHIREHGVQVAVEYDESGNVLDGHHRIQAWQELCAEGHELPALPYVVRSGMTEEQKRAHVRALNILRRHLSQTEQRQAIADQLKETPQRSNRHIADELGVDHKTVSVVRGDLESTGEIPQLDKTVGKDGKARKAPEAKLGKDIQEALEEFPIDARAAIIKTTKARHGKLTPSNVQRAGRVFTEAMNTGHVDLGNGTSTAFDAALDAEDAEAAARQKQYAADAAAKKALYSSESKEWYTPSDVIELVVRALGSIELDPSSIEVANGTVQATRFFDAGVDGLTQSWQASTVFMNPPYGDVIAEWTLKLATEYEAGHIGAAIALVPSRTDTAWWRRLRRYPRCFVNGRIKFISPDGVRDAAPFPSAAIYFGNDIERFVSAFRSLGDIFTLYEDA